jgi:trans-aconitate 2-methyltransferase
VRDPRDVVDLGCGPGNSTAVLHDRWPSARVTGVDNSAAMIEAARVTHPELSWMLSGIEEWEPTRAFDVVFSNAALQWVPDHGPLVERLMGAVAPDGVLAFQIPARRYALVQELIREIASEPEWRDRMTGPLAQLTMQDPAFYYDHLAPLARSLDIWETEYSHVMDSHTAIVEWIAGTGLRPYLAALATDAERDRFTWMLQARVAESYEARADGKILFPFRRTFVIAYA